MTNAFVRPSCYNHGVLHSEHPAAQYPFGIRARIIERIHTDSEPLGHVSFDVPGTAAGRWFIEGAPPGDTALQFGNDNMLLWLARWVELRETRIMSVGAIWPGMEAAGGRPAAPSWEEITPESGAVALCAERIRVEWFAGHGDVTGFTGAARVYTR